MVIRFSHRTQRSICRAMVFVWLFALVTSSVNACVLALQSHSYVQWHTNEEHDRADEDHEHEEDHGPASHDGLSSAPSGGENTGEHSGCHKFCKDESATLTKSLHLQSLDFSNLLVDTTVHQRPVSPVALPGRPELERPFAHGPPVAIRFLRLTL